MTAAATVTAACSSTSAVMPATAAAVPVPLTDEQWLAERGFRIGRGGLLVELTAPRTAAATTAAASARAAHGADACAAWLTEFLAGRGGQALSEDIRAAALAAGFSRPTLTKARVRARVEFTYGGGGGRHARTVWQLTRSLARRTVMHLTVSSGQASATVGNR